MITEPTLDLATILKQIDAAQEATARPTWARGEEAMFDEDRQDSEFVRLLWTHWPVIRAALKRQAKLEAALRELTEADEDYDVDTMTQWPVSQPVGSGERRGKAMIAAKALLAEPAGPVGSRGEG